MLADVVGHARRTHDVTGAVERFPAAFPHHERVFPFALARVVDTEVRERVALAERIVELFVDRQRAVAQFEALLGIEVGVGEMQQVVRVTERVAVTGPFRLVDRPLAPFDAFGEAALPVADARDRHHRLRDIGCAGDGLRRLETAAVPAERGAVAPGPFLHRAGLPQQARRRGISVTEATAGDLVRGERFPVAAEQLAHVAQGLGDDGDVRVRLRCRRGCDQRALVEGRRFDVREAGAGLIAGEPRIRPRRTEAPGCLVVHRQQVGDFGSTRPFEHFRRVRVQRAPAREGQRFVRDPADELVAEPESVGHRLEEVVEPPQRGRGPRRARGRRARPRPGSCRTRSRAPRRSGAAAGPGARARRCVPRGRPRATSAVRRATRRGWSASTSSSTNIGLPSDRVRDVGEEVVGQRIVGAGVGGELERGFDAERFEVDPLRFVAEIGAQPALGRAGREADQPGNGRHLPEERRVERGRRVVHPRGVVDDERGRFARARCRPRPPPPRASGRCGTAEPTGRPLGSVPRRRPSRRRRAAATAAWWARPPRCAPSEGLRQSPSRRRSGCRTRHAGSGSTRSTRGRSGTVRTGGAAPAARGAGSRAPTRTGSSRHRCRRRPRPPNRARRRRPRRGRGGARALGAGRRTRRQLRCGACAVSRTASTCAASTGRRLPLTWNGASGTTRIR